MPMPAHERFYKGTIWSLAAGPEEVIGQKVKVISEVFGADTDLFVRVVLLDFTPFSDHPIDFYAPLSWLA